MKNNKSPGSDGFTADFFKFFWIDVGKFVLKKKDGDRVRSQEISAHIYYESL
jgi:hypothetical protein